MHNRRLRRALILLALVCAVLFTGVALADKEDALEMKTYWSIVGDANQNEPLARAMSGDYAALTLDELKGITKDDLLAFAAAYKLPVSMARHAYRRASCAGGCWMMSGTRLNGTTATTGRKAVAAG